MLRENEWYQCPSPEIARRLVRCTIQRPSGALPASVAVAGGGDDDDDDDDGGGGGGDGVVSSSGVYRTLSGRRLSSSFVVDCCRSSLPLAARVRAVEVVPDCFSGSSTTATTGEVLRQTVLRAETTMTQEIVVGRWSCRCRQDDAQPPARPVLRPLCHYLLPVCVS